MEVRIQNEVSSRSIQITKILLLIAIFLWPTWIAFDYIFAPSLYLHFLPIRLFFCGVSILAFLLLKQDKLPELGAQMSFIVPPLLTVSYMFNVVPLEALYIYFMGATMVLIVGFFFLILPLKRNLFVGGFALLSIFLIQPFVGTNSTADLLANGGFVYFSLCLFGMGLGYVRYQAVTTSIKNELLLEESNNNLKQMVEERNVLLKEVHHRVKNNLQIIASLIKLQEDQIDKKTASEILQLSQDRIRSLSIIHECLYQANDFAFLDFQNYVQTLLDYLSQTYNLEEKKIQIVHDIAPLNLDMNQMVPCGLIINEAVTNSIKHAFTVDGGTIKVAAEVENGVFTMSIQDDGKGFDTSTDVAEGSLGVRLIKGLGMQLKGTAEIKGEGGCEILIKFNQDEANSHS